MNRPTDILNARSLVTLGREIVPGATARDDCDDAEPALSPLPQLDPTALHGPVGDWVRLVQPHTEAAPAALLTSALVSVGALIGRSPSVLLDGARHGVNLFGMLVGPTASGRKGTAVSWVRRLLCGLDPDFAARNVVAGLASGEGVIHAVRDARGATGEKGADPGVGDKRVLVVEAEFSAVLRQMRRDGNTLSAVLREAWDGYTLRTLTKGNPQTATDPHIAVLAQITPEELRRHLEDVEFFNGFANRFLPVWSERTQVLPFGSAPDVNAEESVVSRLSSAVVTARTTTSLDGFSPAGREWWKEHYGPLTTGRPGRVGAATQRGAAQVRRLALLLSILDGADEVDAAQLDASFALWRFVVATAEYVFGRSELSARAQRLDAALQAAGPVGLDRSAIRRQVFGSNAVRAREINAVLQELRDAGTARSRADRETDGRPREVWIHVRHAVSVQPLGKDGTNGNEDSLLSHDSHTSGTS